MAEDTQTKNTALEQILARQARYKSADIMEQMDAAPTGAEMDAIDAKDPADFFAKKIAEAKGKAKMANGGMARGKGGKMYQHNYATGGSVTDHLKSVPAGNKGLSKLPEGVRNQMGYMSYGGMAKKKGKK
jgi:hypothetical protein